MFRLRYYQHDAVDGIRSAHERYRSTACIIPTGGGKTEAYLALAVSEPGRVLVLVHRDYLIRSPIERLEKVGFSDVAVEKAEERAEKNGRRAKVVFASIMSIGPEARASRLETFDPKDFSLVVIDEGHRATGKIYRRVQNYFEAGNPRLKVLILTATPKRGDGVALSNVCDSVAYEMTPAQAAEEGWIVPPRFFLRDVPELDFSQVALKGSDMDPEQMSQALTEEKPLHKICASLAEFRGPTVIFFPRVQAAMTFEAVFSRRYRSTCSMVVHEGTSDEDMERATRGLADGTIDYLFNVEKVTEGYDVPRLERVVWAAPTASILRWTQGSGRGFRPDPSIAHQLLGNREDAPKRRELIANSPKPFCSIVTYFPSNCRHQICSAVDLLGGKDIPPDVKKAADLVQNETARQGGGSSVEEDIETGRALCELKGAVFDARRQKIKARATVVDTEYAGMGNGASRQLANGKNEAPQHTESAIAGSWGQGKDASEAMKKWLLWKGAPRSVTDTISAWRAYSVRRLVGDHGVSMTTALSYTRKQALAVLDKYQQKANAAQATEEALPA